MKKKSVHEDVSCLVDGELGDFQTRAAVKNLQSDERVRVVWERYWLIGDVMRRLHVVPVDAGFADRVSRDLETEPTVLAPRMWRRSVTRIVRPAAGVALAASVMAVAVISLDQESPISPGTAVTGTELAADAADTRANVPQRNLSLESDLGITSIRPIPAATDQPATARYAGLQTAESPPQATRPVYYWESQADTRNRYNSYLVRHNQYASQQARTGFVNYARIVSADYAPVQEEQPDAR